MSNVLLPLHDRYTNPVIASEATGEEAVVPVQTPLEHFFTLVHEDSQNNSNLGSVEEEQKQVHKKLFTEHATKLRSLHEHIQAARIHVKAVSSVSDNILETGKQTLKKVGVPCSYTLMETDPEIRIDALRTVTMSKSRALATASDVIGKGAQRVYETTLGNARYTHDVMRLSSFFLTSLHVAGTAPSVQVGLSSASGSRLSLEKAPKGGVYTTLDDLDAEQRHDAMYNYYVATQSKWDGNWWRIVARRLQAMHKQSLIHHITKVLIEEARLIANNAALFHPFKYLTDDFIVHISATEIQVQVRSQSAQISFPLVTLSKAFSLGCSDSLSNELSATQTRLLLQTLQMICVSQCGHGKSIDLSKSYAHSYSALVKQRKGAWIAYRKTVATTQSLQAILKTWPTQPLLHRNALSSVELKTKFPKAQYKRAVPDRTYPVSKRSQQYEGTKFRRQWDASQAYLLEGQEVSPVTASRQKGMLKSSNNHGNTNQGVGADEVELSVLNETQLASHHQTATPIARDPLSGAPVVFTSLFLTLVRSILSLRTLKLLQLWITSVSPLLARLNTKISNLADFITHMPELDMYTSPYAKQTSVRIKCELTQMSLYCSKIHIFLHCTHALIPSNRVHIPLYEVDIDTHVGVIYNHIHDINCVTSENLFLPYAKPSLLPVVQITTILQTNLQDILTMYTK